jgi:hypothetical protein
MPTWLLFVLDHYRSLDLFLVFLGWSTGNSQSNTIEEGCYYQLSFKEFSKSIHPR